MGRWVVSLPLVSLTGDTSSNYSFLRRFERSTGNRREKQLGYYTFRGQHMKLSRFWNPSQLSTSRPQWAAFAFLFQPRSQINALKWIVSMQNNTMSYARTSDHTRRMLPRVFLPKNLKKPLERCEKHVLSDILYVRRRNQRFPRCLPVFRTDILHDSCSLPGNVWFSRLLETYE